MKYTDGSSGIRRRRSTASAATRPSTNPLNVPTRPITMPCAKKIRFTDRADIPMVLRMPISLVLSVTTIVNVLTMLNAATRTISSRITVMPSFSSFSAWKSDEFCCCQSSVLYGKPSVSAIRRATRGASHRSPVFTSIPVTALPSCARSCAAGSAMMTYLSSYSYMPVSKMPVTSYFPIFGTKVPVTALIFPEPGVASVTESTPTAMFKRAASRLPSTTPSRRPCASRNVKSPPRDVCRIDVTSRKPGCGGTMPMTKTPS